RPENAERARLASLPGRSLLQIGPGLARRLSAKGGSSLAKSEGLCAVGKVAVRRISRRARINSPDAGFARIAGQSPQSHRRLRRQSEAGPTDEADLRRDSASVLSAGGRGAEADRRPGHSPRPRGPHPSASGAPENSGARPLKGEDRKNTP